MSRHVKSGLETAMLSISFKQKMSNNRYEGNRQRRKLFHKFISFLDQHHAFTQRRKPQPLDDKVYLRNPAWLYVAVVNVTMSARQFTLLHAGRQNFQQKRTLKEGELVTVSAKSLL